MLRRSDKSLYAWMGGALDGRESVEIESDLVADPRLRARAEMLRTELGDPPPDGVWRLPAPGVTRGMSATLSAPVRTPALFDPFPGAGGEPALRPVVVELRDVPAPETRQIVILDQLDGHWRVVSPTAADQVQVLSGHLVRAGAWRVWVFVPAADPPRLALALPGLSLPVAWDQGGDARWAALQDALRRRQVPVTCLQL